MIDKIDGTKMLSRALEFIASCDKTNCGHCNCGKACRNVIQDAVAFNTVANVKKVTSFVATGDSADDRIDIIWDKICKLNAAGYTVGHTAPARGTFIIDSREELVNVFSANTSTDRQTLVATRTDAVPLFTHLLLHPVTDWYTEHVLTGKIPEGVSDEICPGIFYRKQLAERTTNMIHEYCARGYEVFAYFSLKIYVENGKELEEPTTIVRLRDAFSSENNAFVVTRTVDGEEESVNVVGMHIAYVCGDGHVHKIWWADDTYYTTLADELLEYFDGRKDVRTFNVIDNGFFASC